MLERIGNFNKYFFATTRSNYSDLYPDRGRRLVSAPRPLYLTPRVLFVQRVHKPRRLDRIRVQQRRDARQCHTAPMHYWALKGPSQTKTMIYNFFNPI
jgi:hypothetical protein